MKDAVNQSISFDAEELMALARLDVERNDLEAALHKLKQLLTMAEPPAEGLAMSARLYAQLGLFGRAQGLYERYLQMQPNAMIELFQLGMTHYDAGQSKEALAIWEKVLKQNATHPPALFYKGLALAQEGNVADARQSLDVLLKSAPTDNLYFGRAKEVIQAMDTGSFSGKALGKQATMVSIPNPKDAYRTEH